MNEKVKQALELLEYLRTSTLETDVDSMGGLVQTNESCFENEINELKDIVKDFDKYHESQQDLIKGKDEYIAKLCCDRAELKEHEKELIKEHNRLFDLCKEQEKTIAQLTEADYYFETSMALDMLKENSNFALMYIDDIFCLVDTKDNKFEVIDNYHIDTENITKTKCQEINDLREFAKIVATKGVAIGFIQLLEKENAGGVNKYNDYIGGDKNFYLTEAQFNFVKKVVEKYGKER